MLTEQRCRAEADRLYAVAERYWNEGDAAAAIDAERAAEVWLYGPEEDR